MYHCPGCRRRCRGVFYNCLDCEFALSEFQERAFAEGFESGAAWGVRHAWTLTPEIALSALPEAFPPRARATRFLPIREEDERFIASFNKGYRAGVRYARKSRAHYSKHVLPAVLRAAGFRLSIVYTVAYMRRVPRIRDSPLWEPHLLHLIKSFTSLETRPTTRRASRTVDTAGAESPPSRDGN